MCRADRQGGSKRRRKLKRGQERNERSREIGKGNKSESDRLEEGGMREATNKTGDNTQRRQAGTYRRNGKHEAGRKSPEKKIDR